MLEKIAAIANFADQNGQYETANELTQLLKTAQLFEAIKSLFDPSAGGDFLKRLSRGWKRGKFDRRLGLVFAINEEREALNQKIEKLSKPLKEFADKVNSFYTKILSGAGTSNYSSTDFKGDLATLRTDAAKIKSTLNSRDLRKSLDYRNKLNDQQLKAVENLRGVDEQQKATLISLLRGEAAPEAAKKESLPGVVEKPKDLMHGQNTTALLDWLKTLSVSTAKIDRDFSTREGISAAIKFQNEYKYSPAKLLEYFMDKNREQFLSYGRDNFKKAFEEMLAAAAAALKAEENGRQAPSPAQEMAAQTLPATKPAEPGQPVEQIQSVPLDIPASKAEVPSDIVATNPTTEAELVAAQAKADADRADQKRAEELAQAQQIVDVKNEIEALEKKRRGGRASEPAQPKKEPAAVVKKTPKPKGTPASKADDASPLAATTADRLAREITRFGRMQQLKKFD